MHVHDLFVKPSVFSCINCKEFYPWDSWEEGKANCPRVAWRRCAVVNLLSAFPWDSWEEEKANGARMAWRWVGQVNSKH
jgi:hypothetical protein